MLVFCSILGGFWAKFDLNYQRKGVERRKKYENYINEYKFVTRVNSKTNPLDMKRLVFLGLIAFTLGASFDKEEGVKTSTASYYHDKFNGKKTASGEIFDNKKLTAANRTLPFGTKVKITNLKNEKSVIVRVNDRGPFSKKRAFDLSKAAFSKIADLRSGVVTISYEVVE